MVIQLVYMGELGYLAIKGIKPNTENPHRIEKDMIYLEEIAIPMLFVSHFLSANDCIQTGEDGKDYVILKEVEFNLEQ